MLPIPYDLSISPVYKERFETVVFREAASNVTGKDLENFLYENALAARETEDWAPSNRAIELLGCNRGMFGAHKADQGRASEQARPPGYHLKAAIGFIEEQARILGSETVPQLVKAL